MGQRNSRKKTPELQKITTEDDGLSEWGSDFDESFCGPGKICADEWTPLNSEPPSPVSRGNFFNRDADDESVITVQPRASDFQIQNRNEVVSPEIFSSPILASNTAMADNNTFHQYDDNTASRMHTSNTEIGRTKKKIKKKKRKIAKIKPIHLIIDINEDRHERIVDPYNNVPIKIHKSTTIMHGRKLKRNNYHAKEKVDHNLQNMKKPGYSSKAKHHRYRITRKRINLDPRYPPIPPPSRNHSRLKFISKNRDETPYVKAVHRLKSGRNEPPDPFRYRGVRPELH